MSKDVHVLFAQLDPIVRTLLVSIQQDQQRQRRQPQSRDGDDETEQALLAALRVRAGLVGRLRAALEEAEGGGGGGGGSAGDGANEGLAALAEFVLLPPILILQNIGADVAGDDEAAGAGADSSRRRQSVRRTARLRCAEEAAGAMGAYARSLGGQGSCSPQLLEPPIVVQCLAACAMAITSVDDAAADLDGGNGCRLALVRCIGAWFRLARGSTGDDEMAERIAAHMDGALTARLAVCCLDILRPLPAGDPALAERRGGAVAGGKIDSFPPDPGPRGDPVLCLAALEALGDMLDSVPLPGLWKKLLPGTFAGLFRHALASAGTRGTGSLSSPKPASRSIRLVASLLRVALGQSGGAPRSGGAADISRRSDTDSTDLRTAAASRLLAAAAAAGAIARIESGTIESGDSVPSQVLSSESTHNKAGLQVINGQFGEEVNARLPGPLTILLGITSVHRSPSVRLAGVDLCRVLLVDTRDVWKVRHFAETDKDPTSVDLETPAMECLFSLLEDNNTNVATTAMDAVQSYRNIHSALSFKRKISTKLVPRLLDLIQGLPVLARSGRESELRSQSRLIGGYLLVSLELNEMSAAVTSESSKRKRTGKSEIASALAGESVSSVIRSSLSELFRFDYGTLSVSPQIPSKLLIQTGNSESGDNRSRTKHFLYLRGDTLVSSFRMLRFFGLALGKKKGALFFDSCIADICDAGGSMKRSGKGQIDWLDEWAGLIVVANEVLAASFGAANGATEKKGITPSISRGKPKPSKILVSLLSSTLPIITRPPLWNLPTTLESSKFDGQAQFNVDDDYKIRRYIHSAENPWGDLGEGVMLEAESSASAFSGNAIFTSHLIETIGTAADLLGKSIRPYLPTILFPVLEKMSINHHHHVQQAAFLTLGGLARADGSPSITSFISKHFDYLVDAILLKLRKTSRSTDASHYAEAENNLFYSGVLETMLRSLAHEASNGSEPRHVLLLADLMDRVLVTYDDSLARRNTKDWQEMTALGLLNIFKASVDFLIVSMPAVGDEEGAGAPEKKATWLDILSQFKKRSERSTEWIDEDEKQTSELGCRDKNGIEIDGASVACAIATVNSMLSRCCYLLSSSSLKVEAASCDVIADAFRFLSVAESLLKLAAKEGESVGNPSLVAISDNWPSVHARLKSAAQEIRTKNTKSSFLLASSSRRSTALLEDEIFVSKLLDVVKCFCDVSGDFMVGRFEQDAWPILAQLLGHEVMLRQQHRSGRGGKDKPNASNSNPSPSRRQVSLLALLDFIAHCFGPSGMGPGLVRLVFDAGTVILPLLADDGDVGDAAYKSIQSLLSVDSDALWRPLLVTSGGTVGMRPFKSSLTGSGGLTAMEGEVLVRVEIESTMMKQAKKLLAYADSLPEQVIM